MTLAFVVTTVHIIQILILPATALASDSNNDHCSTDNPSGCLETSGNHFSEQSIHQLESMDVSWQNIPANRPNPADNFVSGKLVAQKQISNQITLNIDLLWHVVRSALCLAIIMV